MKSQVRNTILVSIWLFLLCFSFFFSVQSAYAESIDSFHALIEVQPNGELLITETIRYDFGSNDRHGIYRKVRDSHPQDASNFLHTRYIEPTFKYATRDNVSEQYKIETGYRGMSVRVGDPNRTITGLHEYTLQYTVSGSISTYDGQTEVYWNVTGDEWSVPMDEVLVTLKAVGGAELLSETACYGLRCEFVNQGDSSTRFTAGPLVPGTEITIAQQVGLPQEPIVLERMNWILIVPAFLTLFFLTFGFITYRWRTKFRLYKPVIAQYEPYQDFKPMFTGVLLDNRLDSHDITAGIVYLAQQGFISIKQTTEKVFGIFKTKDYEITLKRSLSETESDAHRTLLNLLFEGINAYDPKKTNSIFSLEIQRILSHPVNEIPKVGKVIRMSDLKKNQTKLRSNYRRIQKLKTKVKNDLKELGFIESRVYDMKFFFATAIALFIFLTIGGVLIFSIAAVPMVIFWILFLHERRTSKGYEALNHLRGFRDFLSVTEKERYTFHNAPNKNPEQFMEFLPYAIAFKVEKEWAEVFKDIQIDSPVWYQSDVPGGHFSAVAFSNEMVSFSSSFASSGGSSGSSGGGSSGGGAGGGGGGSW